MEKIKKERIEYIDYLRGLIVMWVVWYHAKHPEFVDYSFRIPLFYFISGVFFKLYVLPVFVKKKVNQIIIPFIFFYMIYFLFYIVMNILKYKNFNDIDYSVFWDLFHSYKGTENFTINPPLWFLCALINLQILMYVLKKLITNNYLLILIALIISLSGMIFFQDVPTYFMFGRGLRYFIYYALGSILGMRLLETLKRKNVELLMFVMSLVFFTIGIYIVSPHVSSNLGLEILDVLNILSLGLIMIILMKNIYRYSVMSVFKFFGMSSIIVLGFHEPIQTVIKIIFASIFEKSDNLLGLIETIITLIILYPCIIFMNKYIPWLVAKKEVMNTSK